jgi:FtsP/CotA-like multicopper oxidase with cupredoxin domain
MSDGQASRREFLKMAGMVAGTGLVSQSKLLGAAKSKTDETKPDYTLRIASNPIEIGRKQIVSGITYNGQFPGPLLRFKEGQLATVEVHNDTDTPEQLHWHGQFIPTDVDGAAEEGTPFIPAHGMRRITFTPGPSGFRFYHTHNRAGADLHTVAKLGRSTSSRSVSRAVMTRKSFWC